MAKNIKGELYSEAGGLSTITTVHASLCVFKGPTNNTVGSLGYGCGNHQNPFVVFARG